MQVRLDETYRVADGPVTLTVTVGEGQRGNTRVSLDRRRVAQGATIEHTLGPGPELRGGELTVTTVVVDTNPDTNRTSVTYGLSGGEEDAEHTLRYEVEREHGRVGYRARFRLL